MKKIISNKSLLAGAFVLLGALTSCEDYLTLYPTDSITKEDFWTSGNDVNNVRAAAYYQLTQNTQKIVEWGEMRSDNLLLNDMKQTQYRYLQEAVLQPKEGMFDWAPMYKGINLCNEVLENGQRMRDRNVDPSFTESDWLPIKAEMTALRALYYFYLVRAYRDVPYVVKSVDTDAAAMAARTKATSGAVILDSLISSVERVLPTAAINYGNTISNQGRWTQHSMRALLADMYLWRACMVMRAKAKGFPIVNADGKELTESEENALSSQLLAKSVENADIVLKKMWNEVQRLLTLAGVPENDKRRNFWFPLIANTSFSSFTHDNAYETVLARPNSIESIFELQYHEKDLVNKALATLFFGNVDGGYKAGYMVANPTLFSSYTKVDPERGYGRTDFRFLSYGLYVAGTRSVSVPVIKGVASSVTIFDGTDVANGSRYEYYSSNSNKSSWQIYRLADIMLIKAEAIARLKSARLNNPSYDIKDAYRAADELFRRNNPMCDTLSTTSPIYCPRLRAATLDGTDEAENMKARYGTYGQDALYLVYCERQREFLGEGKRWFDLVRECEFRGATKDVLNDWMRASTSVRNRLRSIWSLYNPIHVEELKVNGKGYGDNNGQLVQNPAWERYMPKK